jgi:hypothetical protein
MRYGGYRPMVFMQHGLAVAFWMASGTIVGFWIWRGLGSFRSIRWVMPLVIGSLAVTTLLCKSGNAIVLTPIGILSLYFCRFSLGRPLLLTMMIVPLGWIAGRVSGYIPSEPIVAAVALLDADRAQSLDARLEQEELFGKKASQRILLGWGRWGRMFPIDDDGEGMTRGVDGLWTIVLGQYGLLGLFSTVAVTLLGAFCVMIRAPGGILVKGDFRLLLFMFAILGILSLVDCIFNAMINPIFIVASAGIATMPRECYRIPLARVSKPFNRIIGTRRMGQTYPSAV